MSYASTAIGQYNVGGGNPSAWEATDPLFEIGNGTDIQHSNAFTVLKNGLTGINEADPISDLHIAHSGDPNTAGLRLVNSSTNDNETFRLFTSNIGDLRLYGKNQAVPCGAISGVSGAYSASSDRKFKEEINDLPFDWVSFMELLPLVYEFKNDKKNKKHFGLIAQDVMKIYPEIVTYDPDTDTYYMDYSAFGVLAIKAIQEQQKVIEGLSGELKKKDTEILKRLEKLESQSK